MSYYYAAQKGKIRLDNLVIDGYSLLNAAHNAEQQCKKIGMEFLEVRTFTV